MVNGGRVQNWTCINFARNVQESVARGFCHELAQMCQISGMICLQLETLLAEKARLAHENSIFAQENRFLREIVEYHQLTMQDAVVVDEGIEEVLEVSSIQIPAVSPATASKAPSSLLLTSPTLHDAPCSTAATQPPAPASPFIVVPEACPIIPRPPMHPPQAVPPNTRAIPSYSFSNQDAKQQQFASGLTT